MPARGEVKQVEWLSRPAAHRKSPQARETGSYASFEVFCTERVSLTSTLSSGGDWRWRFRSAAGAVLVNSEAYTSEPACRAAVTALQDGAGSASSPGHPRT